MEVQPELLEELECLTCSLYLHPPMFACPLGHTICKSCLDHDEYCRICNHKLGTTRNFGLERLHDLLLLPCSFQAIGCGFKGQGKAIADHENVCEYYVGGCPLGYVNGCFWRGPMRHLARHCLVAHPQNAYLTQQRGLIYKDVDKIIGDPKTSYQFVFFAFRRIFLCLCEIDMSMGLIKWGVTHMGPREESDQFYFSLAFLDGDGSDEHMMYITAGCSPICRDQFFTRGKFILMSVTHLWENCKDASRFRFVLSVHKKDEKWRVFPNSHEEVPREHFDFPRASAIEGWTLTLVDDDEEDTACAPKETGESASGPMSL